MADRQKPRFSKESWVFLFFRSRIFLLFIMLFLQACATTTIYEYLESDPSGAFVYGSQTPHNMQYTGIVTPHTRYDTGVNIYWKPWYYQFKKNGYYNSEIIFAPQLPMNTNRRVWATLKKIPESDEKPIVERDDKEKSPKSKSGTAFFINSKAYLVSNDHVVRNCKSIEVNNPTVKSKAQVIFSDEKNDIAVLKIDDRLASYSAYFRSGKSIRAGDDIITVGFPLGSVLGSDQKVTKGNISSMTGIDNDTSMLQFSAPIQPGNSGGPLLDNSGNVIGVVSGKLSDMGTLKATGSLPQNVNFAIKNQVVQTFLDSHGIEYLTRSSDKNIGAAEVVEQAKKYTLSVQCLE
jgi:S1-C subfamily serine protease